MMGIFKIVSAQNDSADIEITEETVQDDNFQYQQKYKYLDINLREEHAKFKIGVPSTQVLSFGDSDEFSKLVFATSINAKLNPSLSIYIEAWYLFQHEEWMAEPANGFDYSFGSRYYFFKERQISNNTSADNFNGFYLGVDVSPGRFTKFSTSSPNVITSVVRLNFGIEKRIGKNGFVDGGIYNGYYDDKTYKLGFYAIFGFGLSW